MCSLSFVQTVCELEKNGFNARIGGMYLNIPMVFFFFFFSSITCNWRLEGLR